MAEQMDVVVIAGENEIHAAGSRNPEPILLESDGCAGVNTFELPALTDLDVERRIVYVELKRALPPEFLPLIPPFDEEPKALADSYFASLVRFLQTRGLSRVEGSFKSIRQLSTPRARFYTLHFPPMADAEEIARELNDRPEVIDAVAARRLIPPSATPVDPLGEPLAGARFGERLETNLTALENQWYLFRCHINGAWAQGYSGNGVVIADIDWGFFTLHQDLRDRIKLKHNSVDGSSNVSQGSSTICHGTAVLGLAGASNNGLGMAGVAFGADLWAIQAGKDPGLLDPEPWWKAIDFVVEADGRGLRKIIILEVQTEYKENVEVILPIRQSIQEAIAHGVVVCVAAGNGSRDAGVNKNGRPFPATDSILVGATQYDDGDNEIAHFSNFGTRVAVYAPGDPEHDLTCSSGAEHAYRNRFGGTSGAAPKVAGTIALMLEANPTLTQYEIKCILKETGSPIKTNHPQSGVFLNAEAAVKAAKVRTAGSIQAVTFESVE